MSEVDVMDEKEIADVADGDNPDGEKKPPRVNQTVEVNDIGPCKKHIKVTIDRSDIDNRLDEKFKKLVVEHKSQVRGFRPGKAPRKMVEKLYKDEVHRELRGELLLGSLEQLAEDAGCHQRQWIDIDLGLGHWPLDLERDAECAFAARA